MSNALEIVLGRIEGVKRAGKGWVARCPAHDDKNPSLSISAGAGGRVLLHCHAGCETTTICDALGLTSADLFPDDLSTDRPSREQIREKVRSWPDLPRATRAHTPRGSALTRTWRYPGGKYAVSRYDSPSGKSFRPFHRVSDGWKIGDPEEGHLPLYHAQAGLRAQGTIFVVEGEKCVEAAQSIGLCAVTSAHGAQSPGRSDWEMLAGRDVAILPDNDDAGREYAERVAVYLSALSPPSRVKILALPGLGVGCDIADLISSEGADAARETIRTAATSTPVYEPAAIAITEAEAEVHLQPLTDIGNANLFIEAHGQDLRYEHRMRRWFVWTGSYWKRDDNGRATQMAKEFILSHAHREGCSESESKHFLRSQSNARIEAMLKLAQPEVPVAANDFNPDPFLLNCRNGTLDLRTGELREHQRKDMCSVCLECDYNPSARAEHWEKFLMEITDNDMDLIEYLARIAGLALTGDATEHALFILYGEGGNGKSTFCDTLCQLLGEYACEAPPNLLVARHDEHPTEVAGLLGKRFVVASETDEGGALKIQLVKRLTGNSRLSARYMRGDYFEFDRRFKIVLHTNNLPKVRESSRAVWRRVRIVPFAGVFDGATEIKGLADKFREWGEWEGILAWAVQGCLYWRESGLQEPASVIDSTESYRSTEDIVTQFLDDACTFAQGLRIPRGELYREYVAWAEANGDKYPLANRTFFQRIRSLPHITESKVRISGRETRVFEGIGILSTLQSTPQSGRLV